MNDFDYRLALMCGTDIPVPQCQLFIHQPKIKEIALIGETSFFTGSQCLTLYKSMFKVEGKNVLENISNFQIFMMVMGEEQAKDKKEATKQVLQLIAPNYSAMFAPHSLILSSPEGNITIDENNFNYFQETLRLVFCNKSGPSDTQNFNPVNDQAREIAEKLMKARQRVAQQKGSSNNSIFSQYLSILSIGLQMDLQKLIDLTMFQLYDLMERYGLYVDWDIDLRSRLAGGKPDKHPDNWMKNLH